MPYQQPRIPIGRRRERITIQASVTTDDGLGGQTLIRWATVAEPWGQVVALDERTNEAVDGQQLTARHGYLVTIPYQSGITPRLRAIVRDSTMEIHTVSDDEGLRRRLVLQVREVQ
jgi:SPP1 family predicted phage head-tail adaptor